MLGLGADREILRIRLQCGLFVAGAHAARARHSRRLRPVEIGDREIVGARARRAARDGDNGLMGMIPKSVKRFAERIMPDAKKYFAWPGSGACSRLSSASSPSASWRARWWC